MYSVAMSSWSESLLAVLLVPQRAPGVGGRLDLRGIVDQRVGAERPGHAVDHVVLPGHLELAEALAEIVIARDPREIERARQAGLDDRRGRVARRRDEVDRLGSAGPELGHQVVARPHVGGVHLDAAGLLERPGEERVGVALPHHEIELAADRLGAELGEIGPGVGPGVAGGGDGDLLGRRRRRRPTGFSPPPHAAATSARIRARDPGNLERRQVMGGTPCEMWWERRESLAGTMLHLSREECAG